MATDIVHDSRFPDNPNSDELRKLDRQIAERLGWRVESCEFGGGDVGYTLVKADGSIATDGLNYWFPEQPWDSVPEFTNDVNAALTLVEHVASSFRMDSVAPGWWRAWFSPMGTMKTADTPALAICLAFLDWTDKAAPPTDPTARPASDESGVR